MNRGLDRIALVVVVGPRPTWHRKDIVVQVAVADMAKAVDAEIADLCNHAGAVADEIGN